jgi:hypothetical protein
MSDARQAILDSLSGPIIRAMDAERISPRYLAKKLKAELEATEQRVFSTSMGLVYSEPMISWKTRQEARKDAHKLLGHYPAEKIDHNLTGAVTIMKPGEIKKPKKSGMAK